MNIYITKEKYAALESLSRIDMDTLDQVKLFRKILDATSVIKNAGIMDAVRVIRYFNPERFKEDGKPAANFIISSKEDVLVESIIEIVKTNPDEFDQKKLIKELVQSYYL